MPPQRGRGTRGRPPWWPTDEAWPPEPGARYGARQRFLRRMGCLFGSLLVLFVAANAIAFKVFGDSSGPPWPVRVVFGVLFVLLVATVGRVFRRTAVPIGDVMEAADSVAAGDYTVRVRARGAGEVRRLAESFNEMTSRLQANEEQRRHLLADVAHELRTPLAVVRGNLEGMLDGVYPRDDAHLIPILEETTHMARLLEDLRTLSLAEAGALLLHREPADLVALIADVVTAFASRAATSGVAFTGSARSVPELEVDPVRIREVMENLVTNALRYTPAGGTIQITAAPAPGRRSVAVAVSDTGSGIAPEDLPHVFERFAKSADSGGSGLGLAIAKRLVEAHGGEIGAESSPGRGTTIRFTLPIESSATGGRS
jgi:signal transduction histidine kinase